MIGLTIRQAAACVYRSETFSLPCSFWDVLMTPAVSIVMPTYAHEPFVRRALESLLDQTLTDWELLIVDDASPDATEQAVRPYLKESRIQYHRLECNRGLGAALNYGLDHTQAPLVAYLPSDDVYYREHLQLLVTCLHSHRQAFLAYAGVRHHYNRYAEGPIDGYPLQLVQVVHRRAADRWLEREELVTDDLERMYWRRLHRYGQFLGTRRVTCEWVSHPAQLHRLLQEPVGGINLYRQRFQVSHPLRFQTTVGNWIDEVEQYRPFRERPDTPPVADGLKILLVGELAYNADRILALEERGHKLYGLWMPEPYWYNTVGPVPFGHVEDIPRVNWQRTVRQLRPDVIYALLNWQAVPFAHEVLTHNPGIPFVWHFKEGPFICLEKGIWPQLVDLYLRSDGQIYSSPEMEEWFEAIVPGVNHRPKLVLDGDLPKREWFSDNLTARISATTGEIHTVVPGRPIGLHPHTIAELAAARVHVHFYGDFMHGQWREWIAKAMGMAEGHLHLHAHIDPKDWVAEFSRYDAGWLHFFNSRNQGDLRRADWDDLNYPARISTLVGAGLPLLERDNSGSIVATQSLVRERNLGLLFNTMEELGTLLRQQERMAAIRANVWARRHEFTFDHHADRLISFFRSVIANQE